MTGAAPIPLCLVGVGKIARDQHLPAIGAGGLFRLAATVSHGGGVEGVPNHPSLAAMAAVHPEVRAVTACTPPRGRLELARQAFALGLDLMLEKPPAASPSEAHAIVAAAREAGRTLFLSWHSREAAGVEPARQWLQGRAIDRVEVAWKEDVRVWHPGQEWIWEPGIGVFDPGINALSILTRILPQPLLLERARLVFPANRDAPIIATLDLAAGTEPRPVPVHVELDFDQAGEQLWQIAVHAGPDTLTLSQGGARLHLGSQDHTPHSPGEYPRLYTRFHHLLTTHSSDADLAPALLTADAFTLGQRQETAPFQWNR